MRLVVEDLKKGSGAPAEKGDEIYVRYFNFDYKSHQVYEDRWNEVVDFSFTLGSGEVLGAWETGLQGMKAGGRRELIVPERISYGNDQVYVIELLSVSAPKRVEGARVKRVDGTGAKPQIQIPPGRPPKKLVVRELKAGSGKGAVWGERLAVRYVGVKYKTKEVEDRWNEKPPYSFVFGEGDVREGWEIGLKGMKLGARRELILPSRLAYGTGALIYVIELIEMEKLKSLG